MEKHGWRYDRAVHNYLYFRFYYPYVRIVYRAARFAATYFFWFKPLNPVIRMAFNRYHCKVLSGDNIRKILTLEEDMSVISESNKKIIPFKYAYKILFRGHDYIAVVDCPCKKTLKASPDTINSCICVGKGTAYFWVDHLAKKYNARRITQEEALDIIRRFRKMGYVTQAFFKVATGGSTGVICNCHPDTCVALKVNQLAEKFGSGLKMSVESGYAVSRDPSKCRKCGTCAETCHFSAVSMPGDVWNYDGKSCMGCELCVEHCPEGALALYRDQDKVYPLDIELARSGWLEK